MSDKEDVNPAATENGGEIDDLRLEAFAGGIRAHWRLPSGGVGVVVRRREGSPPADAFEGRAVDAKLHGFEDTGLRGNTQYCYRICVQSRDPAGQLILSHGRVAECWSVVVGQGNAPALDSSTAGEAKFGFEAHDFGHYFQFQWRWPEGCRQMAVRWRRDGRHPTGPEDSAAEGEMISLGDYKRRGAYRFEQPDRHSSYHFAVYPLPTGSGRSHEAFGRATLREQVVQTVSYDIRRGFWKRNHYSLRLWTDREVFSLPEVAVLALPIFAPPVELDRRHIVGLTGGAVRLPAGKTVQGCKFRFDRPAEAVMLRAVFREAEQAGPFQLQSCSPNLLKLG